MNPYRMLLLATAATLPGMLPGLAASMDPPGSLDLTQPMRQINGKPIVDDTQREQGLVALIPFDAAGRHFAKGDKIVDPKLVAEVAADLQNQKSPSGAAMTFAVGPVDPDCAACAPITLGWVLSEALVHRACRQQPGQPKSPACTPEEERAEGDTAVMWGRDQKAFELRGDRDNGRVPLPATTFGPKSIAELKYLVSSRFVTSPYIVEQVLPLLDPTAQPVEWGKQ